jgi:hypothetical protein
MDGNRIDRLLVVPLDERARPRHGTAAPPDGQST